MNKHLNANNLWQGCSVSGKDFDTKQSPDNHTKDQNKMKKVNKIIKSNVGFMRLNQTAMDPNKNNHVAKEKKSVYVIYVVTKTPERILKNKCTYHNCFNCFFTLVFLMISCCLWLFHMITLTLLKIDSQFATENVTDISTPVAKKAPAPCQEILYSRLL